MILRIESSVFSVISYGNFSRALQHQVDGSVKGGTGWAVELAKMFNRPLHVFDQPSKQWFTWKDSWKEDTPKIEYDTFVGSGTRYLSDTGREAIEKLFTDSFPQK